MSALAISNVAGNVPTVNQLLASEVPLGYNRRDALFYGLKIHADQTKEVVCLGESMAPGQTHDRIHTMDSSTDHAPVAEADRGKIPQADPVTGEWKLIAYNPVTISGTANYLPKFGATANTLDNSVIYQNGTKIGIGTLLPDFPLHVIGSIFTPNNVYGDFIGGVTFGTYAYSDNDTNINTYAGKSIKFLINNATKVTLDTNGNLGVGVSVPEANLHINGQFKSNVASGTAPFVIASTTLNTNLNADLLDGYHASAFLQSYTETDTLQSVTTRGATTNVTITVPAIKITSGAASGYYLKSTGTDGTCGWYPIAASDIYKGTWNANTNTPTLSQTLPTGLQSGWYYRVVVAGTADLGNGEITFEAGDDVKFNGTDWERIPSFGYTLVTATDTILGGVKIGDNVTITDGVISVHAPVTIATASNATLGLSGQQLSIDADLIAIAALTGTSGLLAKTAVNTWELDTKAYTTNLGTVTSIVAGNGMTFTTITDTGTVTLGTPSTLTPLTSNESDTDTHTHEVTGFEPTIEAGTSDQYWRGDKTWQAFPTIPTVNDGTLRMSGSGALSGSATFTANQSGDSTFAITHSTAQGYVHIPAGGSTNQLLQYASAGTAQWITPFYYTAVAAGYVYAGDVMGGSTQVPAFRPLEARDIPALNYAATNHTHSYDNYQNWKIAHYYSEIETWGYYNINSTKSVQFQAGAGIVISEPSVVGNITTVRISSSITQTPDYWERTGAILSPKTTNDTLTVVTSTSLATAIGGVAYGANSVGISGTGELYGGFFSSPGGIPVYLASDANAFMYLFGTSSASSDKNICTTIGSGAVQGPKRADGSHMGWIMAGMVKIKVRGADKWIAYYDYEAATAI